MRHTYVCVWIYLLYRKRIISMDYSLLWKETHFCIETSSYESFLFCKKRKISKHNSFIKKEAFFIKANIQYRREIDIEFNNFI